MVELNKLSVAEAMKIREKHEDEEEFRVYICGQIGPRGDGYVPGEEKMSVEEAAEYHSIQIQARIAFLQLAGCSMWSET